MTIALLAYLLVMSVIGWPGNNNDKLSYPQYFIVIGVCMAVIFILRYLRIRLLKTRDKYKGDRSPK